MYKVEFTEEELSIILQAIMFYQDRNLHFTEKQYNIAERIYAKIDEIL